MIPKGVPIVAPVSAQRAYSRSRPMSNLELADRICEASERLQEKRRRHTKSFGTLVPHVFMGDVLAHVGTCLDIVRGGVVAENAGEVAVILEVLEQAMESGSRETRNVVAMSFANDGELEPFFRALQPLLGPRLIAQLNAK